MNFSKFTWIYLNLPEFTRTYLNLPEFTWIYLNLSEFAWIYMSLPECTWIYLNSPEVAWIHLNLPELTLSYLNTPEFPWVVGFKVAILEMAQTDRQRISLMYRDPIGSNSLIILDTKNMSCSEAGRGLKQVTFAKICMIKGRG